ncbi:MAG: lysozyme [Pleurocapsa sp. CRU_1_2]|nr:lysozyme [Pleurocapsa sp. CRU_1_2]
MLLDYHIDDFLRELLSLPDRPVDQPPYSGWLTTPQGVNPVQTSRAGIDLIKRWEGCRIKAYRCPAGIWTIGYGHTGTAKPGMCISYDKAEELLKQDLQRFEKAVQTLVRVPLNQNQFDALVSFTYNVGAKAFGDSTLLSLLNQKKYLACAEQLLRWTKAGKVTLKGLVDRRTEEKDLFLS